MAQSELFEQWKLSLSDPVASKYGVDQVNKREQAVADQDIQFLEEEIQDVSVMAGQRMFTDVDMPQWWQTDPLLDLTNIRLPLVSGGGICEAEFFKIQGEIHTDELKKHMDMLYQGVAMIRKLEDPEYTAGAEYSESDSEWLNRMLTCAPDPKAFKAGSMHACVPVMEEYFSMLESRSRNAGKVVKWFKEGVKFDFVGWDHHSHAKAPQRKQKEEAVRSMLGKAVGKGAVEGHLSGKQPHQVQFPNHKSVEKYQGFVRSELEACVDKGVIKKWTLDRLPKVVNGIKVVDDKPKLRLCLNPMYINSYMEYQPVKYENIQALMDMVEKGDYLISSDDKSGYWQMPLHPSMWEYVAFQFEEQVYCFCVTPFGIAEAPRKFTIYKQEVHRPLRGLAVKLGMLLDDRIAIESSGPRARMLSEALILIMVAMGVVINIPDPEGKKAQWIPKPTCRYLGFIVNAAEQKFEFPDEKKQELLALIRDTVKSPTVSNRQLAKVAGKLIAAAPAVRLAPLFARAVYHSMTGKRDWDELYPSMEALKADLQCCAETLEASNEACWWKREATFVVAGDASEFAFGGYAPGGEYPHPIVVSFNSEQLQLMETNQFSSTLREIMCMLVITKVLLQEAPHLIQHKRFVYETDSQTGFFSVMGMKGNAATFPVVREFRLLCAEFDIEIEVVWRPREDEHQQLADFWSKVQDNSEWSLHSAVYQSLIQHPILHGVKPTLDVFASHTTTKVADTFYSKYACPGTSGVDAFRHPWAYNPSTGARHLAYINGPFDKIGMIVRKIREERVDCILVAPVWPRHWVAMLQRMPSVRARIVLSGRPDLCIPGPHVPKPKRKPKHPRYQMQALIIIW